MANVVVKCDGCGAELQVNTRSHAAALSTAVRAGWTTTAESNNYDGYLTWIFNQPHVEYCLECSRAPDPLRGVTAL